MAWIEGGTGRAVRALAAMVALAGCGGGDDEVLAKLDGGWSGTIETMGQSYPVFGVLTWNGDTELLEGSFQITDTATHSYAVRRWDVIKDEAYLDFTDVEDATRGLDLDGTVGDGFAGDASVTYPCPTGTCGYEGTFSLARTAPPLSTLDTGTPIEPGDTGAPTEPGDTGAPTPPDDTGAPPGDTGASTTRDTAAL